MGLESLPILNERPKYMQRIPVFERAEIAYRESSILNPDRMIVDVCGIYDEQWLFYYPINSSDDLNNVDIDRIVDYKPITKIPDTIK